MEASAGGSAPITVSAVGDLLLGDSAVCVGFGLRSKYPGNALAAVVEGLRPALMASDIRFGNLECTLSNEGLLEGDWRSMQLRGDPSYVSCLNDVGFNLLNVANNHATQHGTATFVHTLEMLRATGIDCCGVRGTEGWSSQPVIKIVRGIRVGVLGYCMRPRQYSPEEPAYAEGSEEGIRRDVRRLKAEVDRVIVSLHWGEEFVEEPSTTEIELAHSIVDAGADILLGHHPHVARPVERYRHGVIAYSLGNCIADMVWLDDLRRGIMLHAVMERGQPQVTASLKAIEIDDHFVPKVAPTDRSWARISEKVEGLQPSVYRQRVAATVRLQRLAAYLYALRHIWRFPRRVLAQLAGTTVRNKIRGVWARIA